MIDVQQRPLGPLEQHRPPGVDGVPEEQRSVGDPGSQPFAAAVEAVHDGPPIHRSVPDETIPRLHVLAYLLFERHRIDEIAGSDAPAADLVLVGGPDTPRGRPDLALAAPRLVQQIEIAVVRQDQVRLVADQQARCRPRRRARSGRQSPAATLRDPRRHRCRSRTRPPGAGCPTESGAARTARRRRTPCGRRCAHPGTGPRSRSAASAGRRSCLSLRHPIALR